MITQEVEIQPTHEQNQEHDHRNGMVYEADEHYDQHHQSVVDSEVVEIFFDSRHGLGVAVGSREGGEVEELFPWAARGH